jgi:hypothetical protein
VGGILWADDSRRRIAERQFGAHGNEDRSGNYKTGLDQPWQDRVRPVLNFSGPVLNVSRMTRESEPSLVANRSKPGRDQAYQDRVRPVLELQDRSCFFVRRNQLIAPAKVNRDPVEPIMAHFMQTLLTTSSARRNADFTAKYGRHRKQLPAAIARTRQRSIPASARNCGVAKPANTCPRRGFAAKCVPRKPSSPGTAMLALYEVSCLR